MTEARARQKLAYKSSEPSLNIMNDTGSKGPSDVAPVPLGRSADGGRLPRDLAIDALRGFALFGIVVVNAPLFAVPINTLPAVNGWADAVAAWAVFTFGVGKFFLIFSLLFGFGMAELVNRAVSATESTKPVWRRLAGLVLLGAFHAVFLFVGDILMLYAILGAVLVALRNASERALINIGAVAFAVGLGTQTLVIAASLAEVQAASSISSGNGYFGGFVDAAWQRLAELPVAVPFVLLFNGPVALSMMLAGVVWHRRGGLASLRAVQSFQRCRILIAALVALIISSLTALVLLDSFSGAGAAPIAVSAGAALVACIAAPLVSAGLVLLFVAHADRHRFGLLVRTLAALGTCSLTGYLLHSVLLSGTFLGWGLGLFGAASASQVLLISLAVYAAMLMFAAAWMRLFRLGPVEWLLRSLVEGRWLRLT
jgi:uncharacterized protein